MSLRRRQEWEMVATVRDCSRHQSQSKPHPGCGDVRSQEDGPKDRRQQVTQNVLHRMGIDGCHSNRSSPLVVHLVNTLIEKRLMEQAAMGRRSEFKGEIYDNGRTR